MVAEDSSNISSAEGDSPDTRELRKLITLSKRSAHKRSQEASTIHILLALVQHQHKASSLLARVGIVEQHVLPWLTRPSREHPQTFSLVKDRALRTAKALGARSVGPEHVMLALLRSTYSDASQCLASIPLDNATLSELLEGAPRGRSLPKTQLVSKKQHDEHELSASEPRARSISPPRRNTRKPKTDGHSSGPGGSTERPGVASKPVHTGPPHKAATPTSSGPSRTGQSAGDVEARKHSEGSHSSKVRRLTPHAAQGRKKPEQNPFALHPDHYPFLSRFGRNLSEHAASGAMDPLIGRAAELESILDVLGKRRANNPLLVGPPGVGKTALVEGAALHLIKSDPSKLGGAAAVSGSGEQPACPIIVELSTADLLAGTGMRGALSQRVRTLIEEVQRGPLRVVLFIDEIHSLVMSAESAEDLGNQLKSALSRGDLPCIGATTEAEFKRYLERDPALLRRFTRIDVTEPSVEVATEVLSGLRDRYEHYHRVTFDDAAVSAAVTLTHRFLSERKLPEKAIGVLDTAGARSRRLGKQTVDSAAIAQVVSELSRVPVERMLRGHETTLLNLEAALLERVVGHRGVISEMARLLRARFLRGGVSSVGTGPIAVFLLLGPSGVGKTETAKALGDILFPDQGLTRVDMSTLSESHTVARLFGAPPGYVGHDQGGQLTESVRRNPYQLLLLDEVEKAHPQVWLSLLPLFDEGYLVDSQGRKIDFTHTVVCMTSNLGAEATAERVSGIGFRDADSEKNHRRQASRATARNAIQAARHALPPELWNRIDEALFFEPLDEEARRELAMRALNGCLSRLTQTHGVQFEGSAGIVDLVTSLEASELHLGARPIARRVMRLVEAPLAQALLDGRIAPGDVVQLSAEADKLSWKSKPCDALTG